MTAEIIPAAQFIAQIGSLKNTSQWIVLDQARINNFAETTLDKQFIHVDVERAKAETPFGGTIAHGFLSLSMLSSMIETSFPRIAEAELFLNYGFDKIRFLHPVPAGSNIRSHIKLIECSERKPGELLSKYDISIEIENIEKPALVAHWLGMAVLKKGTKI